MSHYWARFRDIDGRLFRFDTRLYLQPCKTPRRGDRAIGCIVGKNPGSAVPTNITRRQQALTLQGDRFLPNVLAVVLKAYALVPMRAPERAYIQVLNLFYLCDRDLRRARLTLRGCSVVPSCRSESTPTPWTWYAWGGPDPLLDPLKERFLTDRRARGFFYCGDRHRIESGAPDVRSKARHTQGMPHTPVVQHLHKLLLGSG